jgi:HAD superfamily hydrolase (TIGR01549 family)
VKSEGSPRFKAVLFDLDDTLLDRRTAYDYAYRRFYEDQPAIHNVTPWEEARAFFWSLSPNNATDARTAILQIMRRWPGVKSDPETHRRYYFERLIEGLKPLPGVPELLGELNLAGIPWGVVTNGDQYQFQKVEKTGLKRVIPFVLASQVFGAEKPQAAIFQEAVRLLGIDGTPVSNVLFAGDNPFTDIKGAHGAGMKTAWVKMGREYDFDAPRPDYEVNHVSELKPLLGLP